MQNELEEFLYSKSYNLDLMNYVTTNSNQHDALYRGIMINKNSLKKGLSYKHWEKLVSWSIDIEVAKKFANNELVSIGAYYAAFEEKHGYADNNLSLDELEEMYKDEFVKAVLYIENEEGFYINGFINDHEFSYEKEVIVNNNNYIIGDITYVSDENYYLVKLLNKGE